MAKDPEVQAVDGVPVSPPGKATAAFTASEIAKAQDRTAEQADKAADRLDESNARSIEALKEAHTQAIEALKASMAAQVTAEEKRGTLYLRGLMVMASLFALSLVVNLVLISGVFRSDVAVSADGGVTIGNRSGTTKVAPQTPPGDPQP